MVAGVLGEMAGPGRRLTRRTWPTAARQSRRAILGGVGDERTSLTDLIRAQLAERDVWEVASTHILCVELRERLAGLGVQATPDVSVALMAVAMLLADKAPEWGGDFRDTLGEIAQLGLRLLVDEEDEEDGEADRRSHGIMSGGTPRSRPAGEGSVMQSEYALRLSEAELTRYRFMAETAARDEREWWTAAGVGEGAVVADVGCGPGAVSLVLARSVGPSGRVIAVDSEPAAVAAAREAAERESFGNVTVQVGEADATGVPSGSADVVMIRHVLAHNGGREAAIVEHAASLVRPGGAVYLADVEAAAIRMRPADPDLEELGARYGEWHRSQGNDLSVGLRLGELLQAAGLEGVEHHGLYQVIVVPPGVRPPSWAARDALVEAGLATADDLARWEAAFDRLDRADTRPTMFVPLLVAYGFRSAT